MTQGMELVKKYSETAVFGAKNYDTVLRSQKLTYLVTTFTLSAQDIAQ